MASPKSELTLYVEKQTEISIWEFLENGTKINMIRDLWYRFKKYDIMVEFRRADNEFRETTIVKSGKHKGELGTAHTDESWSDKISVISGKVLERIAMSGRPSIYQELGLESERFVEGEVPIIFVYEKKLSQAKRVVDKYHAGYLRGSGQTTTSETSHMCAYLEQCGYGKGYVFIVADYDRAGEVIYEQVKTKVESFTSNIEIEVLQIDYGDDKLDRFETYSMTDNTFNSSWFDRGETRGIEFNDPDNVALGIVDAIEEFVETNIDKRMFSKVAYEDWRWRANYRNKYDDAYLQNLIAMKEKMTKVIDYKIKWREKRHFQKMNCIKVYFDYDIDGYSTKAIENDDEITYEDALYFEELLNDDNPYDGSLQTKTMKNIDYIFFIKDKPDDEAVEFYDAHFKEDG